MTEETKMCFSNMWFTATIGYALCWFVYIVDPIKMVLMLLLYPAAFFITKLFLKCNIQSRFTGFFVGAIFSLLGTAIILGISSLAGKVNWFTGDGFDGLAPIYQFIAAVLSFLIGGIAGAGILPGKYEPTDAIYRK